MKGWALNIQRLRVCILCASLAMTICGNVAAQVAQNTTYRYAYDANGNLTQITNPLGQVTSQSYDALNRVKQQLQPTPVAGGARPSTGYTYDGRDHTVSVVDPRNVITSYTYDGLDNQTKLISPNTGITNATYDEAGNLRTSTDARGKTTSYAYDALNRITNISYSSGTATTFEYDGGQNGPISAKGRLTRMTDESGQTSYSYDARGHLASKTQAVGTGTTLRSYTVSYSYAPGGKLASVIYPSGNRVNFGYDNAGRINRLNLNPALPTGQGTDIGNTIALLTNIGHAPFGAVDSWTWGNSTGTEQNTYARGFDLDGRMISYPMGNALAGGLNRMLTYDAASRITGVTHTGIGGGTEASGNYNQNYAYDNLDRLTGFTGNAVAQSYAYDASGNRTQASFGGTSYGNTLSATSNRLMSAAGPSPAKTYSYDAAGHITGDGSRSFSYSDRGRMKNATGAGGTVEYLYNGYGQRVRKSGPATLVPDSTNDYVYDEQGRLLGEYDSNGRALQETVYLGDIPVAMLTGAPENVALSIGNIHYVYSDHLNTPRVLTRASDNKIVWRWDNADPFGLAPPDDNPSGLGSFTYNLRFPGQYFDKETNLHYNYFRDYDPAIGRYIQSDPIGLDGGINTYVYVNNQPTIQVDPLGLMGSRGNSAAQRRSAPGQVTGTLDDFKRNYQNMRDANTIGGDKYFHCMANCEAARRGSYGEKTACLVSDVREWTDQNIKGDPPQASNADQFANASGRSGGATSSQSCQVVCGPFRPNGLPSQY
jgi:RHS repeat-associated protein